MMPYINKDDPAGSNLTEALKQLNEWRGKWDVGTREIPRRGPLATNLDFLEDLYGRSD
jgi:hypothetical protein